MGCIDGGGQDGFLACTWEVTARKLGNVHRYADFDGASYLHFIRSAQGIVNHIQHAHTCWLGFTRTPLAVTIAGAIDCTRYSVGTNTNLGIVLLLMPLAAVLTRPPPSASDNPRQNLNHILSLFTVEDASRVYRAIRLASPGGLGDAPEQDVRSEPTVTLLEAMRLAADRDLIARQYANGFADVFDFGVPALMEGFERFGSVEAAIVHSQLRWLAEFPDSLIARKNGPAVAEDVRKRAEEIMKLGGIATPEGRRAGVALDRHLRADGNKLNPGTIADLIAACLFVAVRENKLTPSAHFTWKTDEWL